MRSATVAPMATHHTGAPTDAVRGPHIGTRPTMACPHQSLFEAVMGDAVLRWSGDLTSVITEMTVENLTTRQQTVAKTTSWRDRLSEPERMVSRARLGLNWADTAPTAPVQTLPRTEHQLSMRAAHQPGPVTASRQVFPVHDRQAAQLADTA